jgi:hypothetical protein
MKHDGKAFQYLQHNFPEISEFKIKERIFISPQIKDFMKDKHFNVLLKGTKNLLGNA